MTQTNEMLARLDASQKACFDAGQHIAAMDIQDARAYIGRLAATPARDVREACAECLTDLADALEEGGATYNKPQVEALRERAGMILSLNLDAAAPAAGGDIIAWVYEYNDIHDYWRPGIVLNIPVAKNPPSTHYGKPVRNVRGLYDAPPLQAPAVSEAVGYVHETELRLMDEDGRCAELKTPAYANDTGMVPVYLAAKFPAVSEADVGRIKNTKNVGRFRVTKGDDSKLRVFEHVEKAGTPARDIELCECRDRRYAETIAIALEKMCSPIIQSAAQGGGTEGGEA